jgi:predicted RNA polymerase sigma factor
MGRVLATLIGFLGNFDLAEEAAQDAFGLAAEATTGSDQASRPVVRHRAGAL